MNDLSKKYAIVGPQIKKNTLKITICVNVAMNLDDKDTVCNCAFLEYNERTYALTRGNKKKGNKKIIGTTKTSILFILEYIQQLF